MSFLWHARRICGIALNNEWRDCWDPSLLASLVVASKRMSHEMQHRAILNGLDRIGRVTGWEVNVYKSMLLEEWGVETEPV
jgi:hypothetical protein